MRLFHFLRRKRDEVTFQLPEPTLGIRLRYPLSPAPRIAVFGFRPIDTPAAQMFSLENVGGLTRFRPQSLAASLDTCRRLLAPGRLAAEVRSGLDAPLIVFSDLAAGFLTPEERDWLWHETGLPVFEQWRGFGGELLAWECEARDGFHFDPREVRIETSGPAPDNRLLLTTLHGSGCQIRELLIGYTGSLDTRTCACGSSLPRATGLTPVVDRPRTLAVAV